MATERDALLERLQANIPQELRDHAQWVVWRLELRGGKPTKVPYSAATGAKAKSSDRATWSTFARAGEAYRQGNYAGVGFVFSAQDPYVGIDFDHCVEGDVIRADVAEWVRQLDSYAEYSQSGTGIHVIVRGALPQGGRKNTRHGVELYDSGRFFVMTGDVLPSAPTTINERFEALAHIYRQIFGWGSGASHSVNSGSQPVDHGDRALLDRMFASAHGAEIANLWDGDIAAYNHDHSAADLALCNHLAFWTGRDAGHMDRLFRQSGLMREKWDRKARVGETYGQGTIARAIAATTQTYARSAFPSPGRPSINSGGEPEDDPLSVTGAPSPSVLPTIIANDRSLPAITEDALAALRLANGRRPAQPMLYVRAGLLTRVVEDEQGEHVTQPLNEAAVRGLLARCAHWVRLRVGKDGYEVEKPTFPPSAVVRDLLSLGTWTNLPALTGIVHCPTVGPSGRLNADYGYNPETRLFHACTLPLGDTRPTAANVRVAKQLLLDELLVDFPFDSRASRAHALALLLLPFVLPLIDGPTPIHAIDAPTPGTGKGLLANTCAFPARGRDLASMPAAQDDNEWRKRLTAVLLRSDSHILIDNVTHPLDSASLAAALTQPVWSDRLLGQTFTVHLPIRQVWIVTGNNLVVSDEIARRCVRIRLDANVERPDQRSGFKHESLMPWVRTNRSRLVTAALTLVQAWIAAGMPRDTTRRKGSYEAWAEVLGGILATVEIDGFLGNDHELYEAATPETARLVEFVEAWYQKSGDQEVHLRELFKLASRPDGVVPPTEQGQWLGLLDDDLGSGNELSRRTRLGRLLDRNQDKVIANYKLCKQVRDKKRPRFRLVKLPEHAGHAVHLPGSVHLNPEDSHTGTSDVYKLNGQMLPSSA